MKRETPVHWLHDTKCVQTDSVSILRQVKVDPTGTFHYILWLKIHCEVLERVWLLPSSSCIKKWFSQFGVEDLDWRTFLNLKTMKSFFSAFNPLFVCVCCEIIPHWNSSLLLPNLNVINYTNSIQRVSQLLFMTMLIKDVSSCEAQHLSGVDPAGRSVLGGGWDLSPQDYRPRRADGSCNYSSRGELSGPKYEERVWACRGGAEDHG